MAAGDFDVHIAGAGPLTMIPTPETALLHPSSVYGITKQSQEALILTTAPAIGVEAVSLRYQNVYGPGQSLKNPYTGILSIFSTLIRQGKPINIFEDGQESRDFVFIDDVVEATYRACVTPGVSGSVLNVGSGIKTTVTEVVEALFRAFGVTVPVTVSGNYRVGDIRHNVADTSRIRESLGFSSHVGFDEGIERFAAWVLSEPLEEDSYERSLAEMSVRNLLK
jgi:dTDP-L-rhamnose 4-epimerase